MLASVRAEDARITNHPLKNCAAEMKQRQLCGEIVLNVLSAEDIQSLLRDRFTPNQFPHEFAFLIRKRTDGHPLFTVSLLDFLAASGDLSA